MNPTLLQPLLNLPDLPQYVAHLQEIVADEERKRNEFYNAISEKDKAEFINGQMILHSPVKSIHNIISNHLLFLLTAYVRKYQLGYLGHEKIMVHLSRNSYEPDICFFGAEKAQHFTAEQMLFPAPDFVVEILSKSTEKTDRGIKMTDYALHGVAEYWLIEPEKRTIEQYVLDTLTKHTFYLRKKYSIEEDIESKVVTGFKIPVLAIFEDTENMQAVKMIFQEEIKP